MIEITQLTILDMAKSNLQLKNINPDAWDYERLLLAAIETQRKYAKPPTKRAPQRPECGYWRDPVESDHPHAQVGRLNRVWVPCKPGKNWFLEGLT